jgi:hypothetical protein
MNIIPLNIKTQTPNIFSHMKLSAKAKKRNTI